MWLQKEKEREIAEKKQRDREASLQEKRDRRWRLNASV